MSNPLAMIELWRHLSNDTKSTIDMIMNGHLERAIEKERIRCEQIVAQHIGNEALNGPTTRLLKTILRDIHAGV